MPKSHFCSKINTFWTGCSRPHPSCPWAVCSP